MAMVATGRPPPEVVQPPMITPANPLPITYANLFKSPSSAIGENLSHGGNPSFFYFPRKPIHYLHGEPTIRLNHQEVALTIEQQELNFAVIGKFSHGMPDLNFLRTAIPKQCELKAEEQSKSFFMRTFKWDVWFNPEEETSLAVIWISFPSLAPNFIVESILISLASSVGKPISIDAATRNKTRLSCARVKVKVDMRKEQYGEGIKTISGKIQYDILPKYCPNCKLQGHDSLVCWKLHPKLSPEKENQDGGGKEAAAAKSKDKATNPISSSSNSSRQTPTPTTNAPNPTPTNTWVTVTGKNRENKNRTQIQPSKPTETAIQATGTMNTGPRAIEIAIQGLETASQSKTTNLAKISDVENPTGIIGAAAAGGKEGDDNPNIERASIADTRVDTEVVVSCNSGNLNVNVDVIVTPADSVLDREILDTDNGNEGDTGNT
ncbi:hypothetical protein RND71_019074 [Anisodus tanguticus]|uniref:DUF4283 domain-containing protein n=1 Tax=Anisodus tanguticus TaxID=243964 RepID=A0AAE1VBK6_9SOLA|nr:hypothetical protein RND71_019074 [Anisodus tanguticus]